MSPLRYSCFFLFASLLVLLSSLSPSVASARVIDSLYGAKAYPGQTAKIKLTITEASNCRLSIASRQAAVEADGPADIEFLVKLAKRARPGSYRVTVNCSGEDEKTTLRVRKGARSGKARPVASIRIKQNLLVDEGEDTITPHPIFVADFPVAIGDGNPGWVYLHYLPIGAEASGDSTYSFADFARGAATSPLEGVTAVPLLCSTPGEAEKALIKAEVEAPVYVWTAPDCKAQLNVRFAGLTESNSGRLRLIRRSDGRPFASWGMINAALADKSLPDASWVHLYSQTKVSLPNIFTESEGALRGYEVGDTMVQHFWDGCPTCRKDESEHQLQGWVDQYPGAQVMAVTCSDKTSAGQWAYEHGWRFPVIAYSASGFNGECWHRMKAKFGFAWYGDKAFLRSGTPNKEAYNIFKGVPW